jgi:hypothetical protein
VLYPAHVGETTALLAKKLGLADSMHYAEVREYRQKAMGEALLH